ncbi:MAG: sugar phosphate isomerase/epimerase [Lachnospiraceae bacterium]|nr:sugar phosphate isomerase/epimerase [Lachnospiraceae bacterium]
MKHLSTDQIAVANYPYGKYSLGYTLDSLQRIGGKKLELYCCDPHFHIDDVTVSDIKNVKKKIKDHNLEVVCITPEQCIYPVNIASKNVTARKRSLEVYVKCLEIANEMESPICQLLSGFGCLDEKDEDIWERSAESISYLADIADSYGIDIALETSPKSYTCLTNAKEVMKMIQEVGAKRLYGMLDTAVLGYSGEDVQEVIEILGDKLRHVHFADGIPNGHFALGEGKLDLTHMLQCLNDASYKYFLSLEIMNAIYVENPEQAMKSSYDWLTDKITQLV